MKSLGAILLVGMSLATQCWAQEREICMYVDAQGAVHQVNQRSAVPEEFQQRANCFSESRKAKNSEKREVWAPATTQGSPSVAKKPVVNNGYMAEPDDIKLKGTKRREEMASPVGRIELRWPRSVEVLFGRTPLRAMQDAALAVSRALHSAGFPPALQQLDQNWSVVFMDESVPETQIPSYLVNNCHPAWMTPPANLYVVAQRVVAGCGNQGQKVSHQVADEQLAHILIHEMGHAVEYQLLKDKFSEDRMRAEGFASWFEQYGSDYSVVIKKGAVRAMYVSMARQSIKDNPGSFNFQGSGLDYARASMFFNAVVAKRGVKGLIDVYQTMVSDSQSFFGAIEKRLGWDQKHLNEEVLKVVS